MADITVQQWSDHFAILVPADLAHDAGLSSGQRMDGAVQSGTLFLSRRPVDHHANAQLAVDEIIAESRHYTLATSIRALLNEGRRD